jgi:uncharacterized membrane protein YeaQ/YmgE (transglycosylase-associated protein family)
MTLLGFAILLLIAFICGSIAQALAGGGRGGCLVSIALGFIGALIGSWIAEKLGLPVILSIDIGDGERFPIIWSIMGGALFSAVLGFFTRRRRM